ncbi:programmed cell death protein 7-like [Cylas formicarius]|uniref:programmed cell death protein 7-like n=1 Tax=Cylas formicarius TaxID=197179 RepID=UPI002958BFB1|nr:programmed cell death protein 7-like [Cylas formicarius]
MNFFNYHTFPSTSRHASDVAAQIFERKSAEHKSNVLENIYNKSSDDLWIESWLQQNNIYTAIPKLKRINVPLNAISIHNAKTSLRDCLLLLEKLSKVHSELEANVSTMSSIEWKQRTVEIGVLKDEFTKLMCKFDNPEVMRYLKTSVLTRKKKRQSHKKQKTLRRLQHTKELEDRNKLHKEIDHWLLSMHDELEKIKMEENMQKEADLVLSEVTKKKSDARKQLSLIIGLVKLRTVRENVAIQRGERPSLEDKKAFNITTEKLVKMWEASLKTYSTEEQGLKLMLEKNATEDSKAARLAKERKLVEEWKTVLFGSSHSISSTNPTYWALTAAERDMETFVAIRKSWDTFLVPPKNESGSKIPVGWVLPNFTPSQSWSQYLDWN